MLQIRFFPDSRLSETMAPHLTRVLGLKEVSSVLAWQDNRTPVEGDDDVGDGSIYVEVEGFDRTITTHAEVAKDMADYRRMVVDSIPQGLDELDF